MAVLLFLKFIFFIQLLLIILLLSFEFTMDQRPCRLCSQNPTDAVMLVCAHQLCYHCALKIQVLDTSSLIQGKYRIQCPECRRSTYTYELQNLLVDTMELNLITDSSELDREQLHESQLSHNAKNKPDAIFQRRVSKIIDRQEFSNVNNSFTRPKATAMGSAMLSAMQQVSAQGVTTSTNSGPPLTPTNHPFGFYNPNSEKASPSRTTTPLTKSKKLSHQFDSSYNDERSVLHTSQNHNVAMKAISGVSTPSNTPFSIAFALQKTPEPTKVADRFGDYEKENVTTKHHKRSSTGLPPPSDDVVQSQIINSYFTMLQKNLSNLQTDIIGRLQKNKNVDANFLYTRLKRLSEKMKSKTEEELVQQIRVIHELRSELGRKEEVSNSKIPPYNNNKSSAPPKPQYLQGKLL